MGINLRIQKRIVEINMAANETAILIIGALLVFFLMLSVIFFFRTKQDWIGKPKALNVSSGSATGAREIVNSENVTMNEEMRAILSQVGDGIIILNNNNEIEYLNEASYKIFAVPRGEGIGSTLIEVVRDYEFSKLLQTCAETGRQQSNCIETHNPRRFFDVCISIRPNKSGYFLTIRDLTEKWQLENIQRDFISNVSHEFRTPLSSIKLLAETLREGGVKDKRTAQNFLHKIDVEVDKLVQIAGELGELTTIQSSIPKLNKGNISINNLIKRSVERLTTQAASNRITICVDSGGDLPDVIADQNRIELVLMNLIYNSIKFTNPGGNITIKTRTSNNSILVSVTDTGIGISPDELPRIFERFYKADKSRSSEGSGLGLTISKHIIDAHGGNIWVESNEGKGSTFYFTLPVG